MVSLVKSLFVYLQFEVKMTEPQSTRFGTVVVKTTNRTEAVKKRLKSISVTMGLMMCPETPETFRP